jgi:hypothetical protein
LECNEAKPGAFESNLKRVIKIRREMICVAVKVEMVKLAERPELQDILLEKVFSTKKLQEFAQSHGFENVTQMFYQTLPYIAEVNQGSGHYAFTHADNKEVLVWDCRTGEQLRGLQYQTPDQAVTFIKAYDQTNVLTEKTLAEFLGRQMNQEKIMINESVFGMER